MPQTMLHDLPLQALVAYGAVILSFLGGIRWGVAMSTLTSEQLLLPLSVSVLPSLAGWSALLLPPRAGLLLLAVGFVSVLIADLRLQSAPAWFISLRVPLSAGAIASLVAGLLA